VKPLLAVDGLDDFKAVACQNRPEHFAQVDFVVA